jgi:uncharacterized protein (DUF1501 family)
MAGGRVGNLVFAESPGAGPAAANDNMLVMVFLRGGCDGLSLVSPYDNAIYVAERDNLAVSGALTLNPQNSSFDSSVGLHPNAAPLKELYDQGHLAIVHACGLDNDTRSHFDAMDYIERGTPDNKNMSSGWLARHLAIVHPDGTLPILSAGAAAPVSLLGEPEAVAMNDGQSYSLSGVWSYTRNPDVRYNNALLNTVSKFYTGADRLQATGKRTIETIKALSSTPAYTPTTSYPDGSFGESLQTIAQMIKLNVGLRIGTVDFGGWDHHESQGVNDSWGPFNQLAATLAQGLNAFYNDLPGYQSKLTVVVMSEFGRRLGKNLSNGTDHGHGNVMLVLGGNVNGGKVYGAWPGLQPENLDQHADLKITTDFRTVLSEIVVRQLGNGKLGTVFPGITPQIYSANTKLGVVNGPDLPIDYSSLLNPLYMPVARR